MIKLLTGNELLTGDVVWWDGAAWSRFLADAVAVDDAVGQALIDRFAPGEAISDLVLVDAEAGRHPGDPPRPRTTRERIRGVGPTVRPDLARAR